MCKNSLQNSSTDVVPPPAPVEAEPATGVQPSSSTHSIVEVAPTPPQAPPQSADIVGDETAKLNAELEVCCKRYL
jgi:hypothetical protein